MDLSFTMIWIIVAVVFGIIEAVTLGLATIWFSVGALVALIFAALEFNFGIQIAVFLITSSLLLYYTRPIAKRVLKIGHTRTNADSLINKSGIVTVDIVPINGTGQVKVNGQIWSAKSTNDELIYENEKVKIVDIQGVKLVVERFELK